MSNNTLKYRIKQIIDTKLSQKEWKELKGKWINGAGALGVSQSCFYGWLAIKKEEKREIRPSALFIICKDLSAMTGEDYTPESLSNI